jgi:uncharacterized protein (DUF433 family)
MTVAEVLPVIRYVTDESGHKTDVLIPFATWQTMVQYPNIHELVQQSPLIVSDPEILSGIPVFAGTRVPVKTLFDYLEAGHPLEEFLDDFPTVTRERAQALLQTLKHMLLESPYASAVG